MFYNGDVDSVSECVLFLNFPLDCAAAQQLFVEKKDRMLVRDRVWGAVLTFVLFL